MEERYQFQFVAAPEDLGEYLNSLYVWRTSLPVLNDVLPAYSGQLVVFAQGSGTMKLPAGPTPTRDAFVVTPLMQAWPFDVAGPALMFGVSLNFRGWHALTGLDVTKYCDSIVTCDAALPAPLAAEFDRLAMRWRAGELSEQDVLDAMADIVRRGLNRDPDKHQVVLERTLEWLSSSLKPELADLYASLPYSERQVQRLVARFFGQSPMRLLRRYRAVRAATLLAMPELTPEIEDEIRDAFYDQAHMIKEISFFTGRTPRLLQPKVANSVVHDMLGPEGYSSVDLFGGNQDEQLRHDRPAT